MGDVSLPLTAGTGTVADSHELCADLLFGGRLRLYHPAAVNCPVCGNASQAGSRFCSNCGTKLVDVGPREGERKLVSVLFADVVGSTRLTELLGAEAWAELMNGAFSLMNQAVSKYGGTVGRLMGDGILAFFGVPVAHEDDAERAVLAALELRDKADEYGAELLRRHGDKLRAQLPPFAVRVGVSTGQTVMTTVGDDVRAEFTAIGETANLAARLQSMATEGTVLIDAATHQLVKHGVEVLAIGAKQVKGFARAVQVFEVLDSSSGTERPRGIEGLSSPMVGRDEEMKALREQVRRLAHGEGRFVTVIGEAGLGKSRLLADLRKLALHDFGKSPGGLAWHEGRAISYASSVPFFALRGTLLATLGASLTDAPELVRARIAATARDAGWEGESHRRHLELILAVETEETSESTAQLDGDSLSRRMTDAVTAYLRHVVRGPTVLVFEDVHWADGASVRLLGELAGLTSETGLPLMIVCALRPDRQAPSAGLPAVASEGSLGHYSEIRLEPLSSDASRELLRQLLGGDDLGSSLASVLERSDGNPFYLEEVLRSLIQDGVIAQVDGAWTETGDLAAVEVPSTLAGVLSARIDKLPETARQVAQAAAVVGRSFAKHVVDSVFTHPNSPWRVADVASELRTLSDEEFVRLLALEPDEEYAFKHALTQEAAYDRLLSSRRALLHRLVGEVLEIEYAGRLDDVAPILAHHFASAGEWLKAAGYYREAGERAFRVSELEQALGLLDQAIETLGRQVAGEDDPEWRIAILEALNTWVRLATFARKQEDAGFRQATLLPRAERALELANAYGSARAKVTALVQLGNVYVLSGMPGTGFGYLTQAGAIAERLDDHHLFLLPVWASTESMLNDDPRAAESRFAEVIELAQRARDRVVASHALGSRALALARLGRFDESLALMPTALAAAEASGSVIKVADVNMLVGGALMEMGHAELGLRYVMYGSDKAFSIDGRECAVAGLHLTGLGEMSRLQLAPAIDYLAHSERMAMGTVMESMVYSQRAARASCSFQLGDRAAMGEIEAQARRADAMQDRYGRSEAHVYLAKALLADGRPEESLPYLRAALAWYRERGMLPYVLKTLRLVAQAAEAVGDAQAAREAEQEASLIANRLPTVDPSFLGEPGTPRAVRAVA